MKLMVRGRVAQRALASLALLSVWGCDQSQPGAISAAAAQNGAAPEGVSNDELAAIIFQNVGNRPCQLGRVQSGDIHDPIGTVAAGRALSDWRERIIIKDPKVYKTVSTAIDGPGWRTNVGWYGETQTFEYIEGGRDMRLKTHRTWGKAPRAMGQKADPEYMQVIMTFCGWVPSHVKIVSTSGSAAANYIGVAYQLHWAQTGIAVIAAQSGATQVSVHEPPTIRVERAVLTRSGKDQSWRVQQ